VSLIVWEKSEERREKEGERVKKEGEKEGERVKKEEKEGK